MKNETIREMHQTFKLFDRYNGVELCIWCGLNMEKTTPLINIWDKSLKRTPGMIELDRHKAKIMMKYVDHDKDGKPISSGTDPESRQPMYTITNVPAFYKECDEWEGMEENAPIYAEYENREKDLEKVMQQETDIELIKIHKKDLPKDLNQGLSRLIWPLIILPLKEVGK